MVFTEHGAQQLGSAALLSEPTPVFALRDGIAVDQATTCELLVLLGKDGWEWEQWKPPSKRTKRDGGRFLPYCKGGDKIFYSGATLAHKYLIVLASADDLFERGLSAIDHGLSEKQYGKYLEYEFDLIGIQDDDLQDLDDVDGGVPMLEDAERRAYRASIMRAS